MASIRWSLQHVWAVKRQHEDMRFCRTGGRTDEKWGSVQGCSASVQRCSETETNPRPPVCVSSCIGYNTANRLCFTIVSYSVHYTPSSNQTSLPFFWRPSSMDLHAIRQYTHPRTFTNTLSLSTKACLALSVRLVRPLHSMFGIDPTRVPAQ